MVISIINQIGVLIFKKESDPPISVHSDGPDIALVTFKFMETIPRKIHISRCNTCIKAVKYSGKLWSMLRLNSLF